MNTRGDCESRVSRFRDELSQARTPGGGGCHAWLLRAANLAALADIDPSEAASLIHGAIPQGGRTVHMREVQDAVKKAYTGRDCERQHVLPPRPPKPRRIDSTAYFRQCEAKHPDPFPELWEASPYRLTQSVDNDAALLFSTLYEGGEHIYCGEAKSPGIPGSNFRTASEWLKYFREGGKPGPHWIPNPLTGEAHPTKDGKLSYRCDAAVKQHRFCVLEFDELSKVTQAAFWLSARLPVAAIIDTGGKSLHGILKVDCKNAAEWEKEIERDFFPRIVAGLGGDTACKNESRMSRTPGVRRGDDWQRLIYLDPDARGIAR